MKSTIRVFSIVSVILGVSLMLTKWAIDEPASTAMLLESDFQPRHNIVLDVSGSEVVSEFKPAMRGVATNNWNYLENGLWDRGSGHLCCPEGKLDAIVDVVKQIEPGIIRFAGGLWANTTGWDRENIAPDDGDWMYTDHATGQTYSYGHAYKPHMVDAFASFAARTGAEAIIQINVCDNNPAMWADMLRYTNIEHDYSFKYWELGNEQTLAGATCVDAEAFASRYQTYRDALRAVDPSIRLMASATHQPFYTGWEDTVFAHNSTDLDTLAWHWYQLSEWTSDTDSFAYQGGSVDALLAYGGNAGTACHDGFGCPGDQIEDGRLDRWTYRRGIAEQKMQQVNGSFRSMHPDLETAITELGVHASEHEHPVNGSHLAAIWLADVLPRWAYNGLDILTYSSLEDGGTGPESTNSRGLIGIWDSQKLDIRPTYYTAWLLANHFGDRMLKSKTSDPEQKVVAWASSDSDEASVLKLMLVNLKGEAQAAQVRVSGFVPASGAAWEMTSQDPLALVDPDSFTEHTTTINGVRIPDYQISDPSVFGDALASIAPKAVDVSRSFRYTLPAYSAVAITLSTDPVPSPTQELDDPSRPQ